MSYYSSRNSTAPAKKKVTSEKNLQIIKTLLKDPGNRYCADCKTSQHPRWASWSLGIFICIRCSGIHRSLGTHISKVRSIDLDTWSDEQLAPLINWGNTRANKYWEDKLPAKYVPEDGKLASFIRTKYDLKRWVASSNIPDPSTLNDDVPLATSNAFSTTPEKTSTVKPVSSASLIPDLLGDDASSLPSSTTITANGSTSFMDRTRSNQDAVPNAHGSLAKSSTANQKDSQSTFSSKGNTVNRPPGPPAKESLLFGVDFSSSSSATKTPSANTSSSNISATSSASASRPDLKKSILSLYSSSNSSAFAQRAPAQQSSAAFDLMSATSTLSLADNSSKNVYSSRSSSDSGPGLFDSLTSMPKQQTATNFAPPNPSSTSVVQPTAQTSTNNDSVHWNFAPVSSSSTSSVTTSSSPIPSEQDIFANVWK